MRDDDVERDGWFGMVWVLSAAVIAGFSGNTTITAVTPLALLAVCFKERCNRRGLLSALVLAAALFGYGRLSSFSSHNNLALAAAAASSAGGRVSALDGWVCGFPEYRYGGVRFVFQTKIENQPVKVLVTGVAFGLAYGDSLRLTGKLVQVGQNRGRYAISRGVGGYYRASGGGITVLRRRATGSTVVYYAGRLHESIRKNLTRNLGTNCGIPLALLIGERGMVSRKLSNIVRQLGISHLLALSGLHLGLIVAAVLSVFRVVRIRNRGLLFLVLTFYVGVVGVVVSLYRAYLMATLLLLARHLERPLQPLQALGTALFVLLVLSPELLYSIAFQLSFAATFAVLLCLPHLPGGAGGSWWRRVGKVILASLMVSTCVQLFLVPLLIYYFKGISVLAPLATVVFLPVVAAVLLFSAVVVAFGSALPSLPAVVWPLDHLTRFFEYGLLQASDLAPDLVLLPEPNAVLYYSGLVLCWVGRRRWWCFTAGLILAVCAFLPM